MATYNELRKMIFNYRKLLFIIDNHCIKYDIDVHKCTITSSEDRAAYQPVCEGLCSFLGARQHTESSLVQTHR